ncbi:MAG: TrbC/VirB2 family protein [Alphaproteobacteria bacterium]|nr:TrbC/VirB2 family protein [Alphaproteobacteria bacterium]
MTSLSKISGTRDTLWSAFVCLALFAAVMLAPDAALAGQTATASDGQNPLGTVLCNIVSWLTGTTGRALATIAIVIIGIGALMGKVSWGMAIIVAIGIAIVFGAGQIVSLLGGGARDTCDVGTIKA